jgi:predicted transcriptional regulator
MKAKSLSAVLRSAIAEFEPGQNELARKTGVAQPVISRFAAGKDIRLETADKLAAFLGIVASRR